MTAFFPTQPKETKATATKTKQTSVTSFFAKSTCPSVTTNKASSRHQHHPEGRFQFFRFTNLDLLQTYVPNNGTKEESFQKRCTWDQTMLQFFLQRQAILKLAKDVDRPLLWCGDMNVAKEYLDGTHWIKRPDGTIYEWWTDESKSLAGSKVIPNNKKHPDNVGIPSFTPAERRRFQEILTKAQLIDVWRELHPQGTVDDKRRYATEWDKPNYTWRGHLGNNGGGFAAKYQGKGQRLDYFLLSPPSLLSAVQSCEILGWGEQRDGLFCGSDHCATMLQLQQAESKRSDQSAWKNSCDEKGLDKV